jgi:hypothetical protein
MKFDRRIPGVSETRRTLRAGVGGGRVNKLQRGVALGCNWAAPSALQRGPVSGGLGGFRDCASLRAE